MLHRLDMACGELHRRFVEYSVRGVFSVWNTLRLSCGILYGVACGVFYGDCCGILYGVACGVFYALLVEYSTRLV